MCLCLCVKLFHAFYPLRPPWVLLLLLLLLLVVKMHISCTLSSNSGEAGSGRNDNGNRTIVRNNRNDIDCTDNRDENNSIISTAIWRLVK